LVAYAFFLPWHLKFIRKKWNWQGYHCLIKVNKNRTNIGQNGYLFILGIEVTFSYKRLILWEKRLFLIKTYSKMFYRAVKDTRLLRGGIWGLKRASLKTGLYLIILAIQPSGN
jgi:hypothetical protein